MITLALLLIALLLVAGIVLLLAVCWPLALVLVVLLAIDVVTFKLVFHKKKKEK